MILTNAFFFGLILVFNTVILRPHTTKNVVLAYLAALPLGGNIVIIQSGLTKKKDKIE